MTVDLPKPASVRHEQKQRLRILLDARLYLPRLVERLSRGFITIDEKTADRWCGWLASLQSDPGWEVIEPVIDMPEAWPEAWERARHKGFSPPTHHHLAIFFTRLFERATQESRFELARLTWSRALRNWVALADGIYLRRQVIEPTVDLSDEQVHQVLATLLDGPMAGLRSLGRSALRLQNWESPPSRRPLGFVLDAIEQARSSFEDETGAIASGVFERADTIARRLWRSVVEGMDRRLENIDFATAELSAFVTIFDGALSRCRHLGFPPQLDRVILRRGLDVIWNLRDAGRDDELGIIPPMVERLKPCTERLREAGDEDFFGLEGAVADLLVFEGEEALSIDDRQEAFEQALEICPGHRNASRLLSYLLLERANRDLLKTAALPDASTRVGVVRRRIRPLVDRAAKRIDQARQLYPENDLLDQYRSDLEGEIERFKLAVEADHED